MHNPFPLLKEGLARVTAFSQKKILLKRTPTVIRLMVEVVMSVTNSTASTSFQASKGERVESQVLANNACALTRRLSGKRYRVVENVNKLFTEIRY
jgi:hypothetical protein